MVDDSLQSLLKEISGTFYSLMKQNELAYVQHTNAGETLFNEKAYWKRRSLFNGELDGQPFRSVVKTFQVKTWRNLKQLWQGLNRDSQSQLVERFPAIDPGK